MKLKFSPKINHFLHVPNPTMTKPRFRVTKVGFGVFKVVF